MRGRQTLQALGQIARIRAVQQQAAEAELGRETARLEASRRRRAQSQAQRERHEAAWAAAVSQTTLCLDLAALWGRALAHEAARERGLDAEVASGEDDVTGQVAACQAAALRTDVAAQRARDLRRQLARASDDAAVESALETAASRILSREAWS